MKHIPHELLRRCVSLWWLVDDQIGLLQFFLSKVWGWTKLMSDGRCTLFRAVTLFLAYIGFPSLDSRSSSNSSYDMINSSVFSYSILAKRGEKYSMIYDTMDTSGTLCTDDIMHESPFSSGGIYDIYTYY